MNTVKAVANAVGSVADLIGKLFMPGPNRTRRQVWEDYKERKRKREQTK